ncbi:MAG: hypothetical protein AAGG38_10230 [Planctomycetota bacterium]
MTLSIRTQRRFYHALTMVCGLGMAAVWATAWPSLRKPGAEPGSADPSSSTARTSTALDHAGQPLLQTEDALTLDTFRDPAVGWDRPLRGPLYDPPPPPPPEAVPPPPLRIKLLGTIIEPPLENGQETSQAILLTASGQVELHRVGAAIDDATLISIDHDAVIVRFHGQTLTLHPAAQ